MLASLGSLLAIAAIARASPLLPRAVDSLNEEATAEAQQRDESATRAFSDVPIKVFQQSLNPIPEPPLT